MNGEDIRERIRNAIQQRALITEKSDGEVIVHPSGRTVGWYFDFRIPFSEKQFLKDASELFWSHFEKDEPLYVGGLESASLPLIASIVLSGNYASGFYVRKSRKKKMQMRQIEGVVHSDRKIVLVDDLINSGSSIKKQIEILKKEGLSVSAIFTFVTFNETHTYNSVFDDIPVISLFTLSDFELTLGSQRPSLSKKLVPQWYFGDKKPHFFEQGPKHVPIVKNGDLFISSDSGYLRRLLLENGKIVYERKVLFRTNQTKTTFPSFIFADNSLFLSTYRGSVLILNPDSGLPKNQKSLVQNFSTPLYSLGNTLIFGSIEGKGVHVHRLNAFDVRAEECTTLLTPESKIARNLYIDPLKERVFVGEVSNTLYALTKEGKVLWKRTRENGTCIGVGVTDFGEIMTLTTEGAFTLLDARTGKIRDTDTLPAFHYSLPTCSRNVLYGATLDREIYCYDYHKKKMVWSYETRGRMYSAPTIYRKYLLVGDNFGELHILNRHTGERVANHLFSERITNPILVTDTHIIVSTFANELYTFRNILNEQLQEAREKSHQ